MDNIELEEKRRGVILTIFQSFKEGLGGLLHSEQIEEEEEVKDSPILKAYVKANKDNPHIEDLLKPIKAEEIMKEMQKGKHNKVVEEVEVNPTKTKKAKEVSVQEVLENDKCEER